MVSTLNILGLVFDISGAWLLFKYALPLHLKNKTSETFLYRHDNKFEKEKHDIKKFDKISKIGFGLILSGFSFQLIANILSMVFVN